MKASMLLGLMLLVSTLLPVAGVAQCKTTEWFNVSKAAINLFQGEAPE